MDGPFFEFLVRNASYAPWWIFGALLLAGLSIPISADLLLLFSALISATVLPKMMLQFYFAFLCGALISAWIAFWMGRLVGPKLQKYAFFKRMLHPDRLERIRNFYKRWGFFTLVIGRFIPFGVRNCLFLASGMSQLSFRRFLLMDLFACAVWSSTCFFLFYSFAEHASSLFSGLRSIGLILLGVVSVGLGWFIWYKWRKRRAEPLK